MSQVSHGWYRDDSVQLEGCVNGPDGAPVAVTLLETSRPRFGLREEDWPTGP